MNLVSFRKSFLYVLVGASLASVLVSIPVKTYAVPNPQTYISRESRQKIAEKIQELQSIHYAEIRKNLQNKENLSARVFHEVEIDQLLNDILQQKNQVMNSLNSRGSSWESIVQGILSEAQKISFFFETYKRDPDQINDKILYEKYLVLIFLNEVLAIVLEELKSQNDLFYSQSELSSELVKEFDGRKDRFSFAADVARHAGSLMYRTSMVFMIPILWDDFSNAKFAFILLLLERITILGSSFVGFEKETYTLLPHRNSKTNFAKQRMNKMLMAIQKDFVVSGSCWAAML